MSAPDNLNRQQFTGFLPVSKLRPSENTPENERWSRRGAGYEYQQAMVQHVAEHGLPDPIEVSYSRYPGQRKPHLNIAQGHHRWHAAKQLGMKYVPVELESYHGRPSELLDEPPA
jgi:hypothetical protein